MTGPPSAILHTSKRKEGLQLFRLREHVPFHCVQCQKNITANRVATKGGDWTQKVCERCYSQLVQKHRKTTQPVTIAQRQALADRARLPGAYSLVDFLCAASIHAELDSDGRLLIDDIPTQRINHLPRPGTFGWRKHVDQIVVDHARAEFNKAVTRNAKFGPGMRVIPQWGESRFSIARGDEQLALIHPTRAYISEGRNIHAHVIHANFLLPGSHWKQVADGLHHAEPEGRKAKTTVRTAATETRTEPQRASAPRRIKRLPADLAPELIAACRDASRRIRLERRVAYPRPVVLEHDLGQLTLLPITGTETRLLLPFRINNGTRTVEGDLELINRDSLPLLIGRDVAHRDAIAAWTCALIGFADATCSDPQPARPAARREPARLQGPPSTQSRRRPPTPALTSKSQWPGHLQPVGRWVLYSNSIVAGHRRRLSNGRQARDSAHEEARRFGIILRQDETWVRAHVRGVPDDIEMRFRWHPPPELQLLHG
jgi:hypothetical protein